MIDATVEPVKDLDVLMRLVLKYIYVYTNKWDKKNMAHDKERMSLSEIHQMQKSFIWWTAKELPRLKNKIERKIWLFKCTADQVDQDEYKFVSEKVQTLAWMIKKNEDGEFDRMKEEFYFKSIDYRKFHRLPEAYKPEDFYKGQEALKEWNIKNPELA